MEVDPQTVKAFLGRIEDPQPPAGFRKSPDYLQIDSAFRVIMQNQPRFWLRRSSRSFAWEKVSRLSAWAKSGSKASISPSEFMRWFGGQSGNRAPLI
jgi:hypothetical protein